MIVGRRIAALALVGAHLSFAGTAFAQACANRADLLLCGSSDRPLSGLYSGIGPFNEVASCAPNANSQAMFVSRNATIAGNGAAWLAYLNGGGRIITEYSNGTAVYNEIYGTAYPDGGQAGGCDDNPMPSAKLNPTDAFWVANPIPVTAPSDEGCGFDLAGLVSGEPSVTPLGARDEDTSFVTFARKPQGGGTLFLLEADWQDTETVPFDANNFAFLNALVTSCAVSVAPPESVPVPVDHPLAIGGLAALIALFGAGFARLRRSRSRAG
ncbi:hypothetical protein BURK1_02627 [Burkholderiales bacterium]|nr:hypothetical protein BURK1_02627 [Burkholderiales bacterium]